VGHNPLVKRPAVLWTASTAIAVSLAALGVVLYASSPGVVTYQLNSLLVFPLLVLVLYWLHRWLPLRLQWIAAWLLAPLGAIAYLAWPNDQSWAYGMLTVFPLLALAAITEERRREERGEADEPGYGGWTDAPWGPP
jgi:hypothetical protein